MRAYVINLSRRPDRWDRIVPHLQSFDMDVHRIPAVDGRTLNSDDIAYGWKKQGRSSQAKWLASAACYFSHIKALEAAIDNGIFPCLILEDDAVLNEKPEPEPGMVYLGGFESPKGIYGLHAVMYETVQDAADFLLYLITHKNTADSIANQYRKENPDLVRKYSKGFIATQAVSFSDIEGAIISRSAAGSVRRL